MIIYTDLGDDATPIATLATRVCTWIQSLTRSVATLACRQYDPNTTAFSWGPDGAATLRVTSSLDATLEIYRRAGLQLSPAETRVMVYNRGGRHEAGSMALFFGGESYLPNVTAIDLNTSKNVAGMRTLMETLRRPVTTNGVRRWLYPNLRDFHVNARTDEEKEIEHALLAFTGSRYSHDEWRRLDPPAPPSSIDTVTSISEKACNVLIRALPGVKIRHAGLDFGVEKV